MEASNGPEKPKCGEENEILIRAVHSRGQVVIVAEPHSLLFIMIRNYD